MPRKSPELFPIELRDYVATLAAPDTPLVAREIACADYADARALQADFDAYIAAVRATANLPTEQAATYAPQREQCRIFRQSYQVKAVEAALRVTPRSDGRTARRLAPALGALMAEAVGREADDRAASAPPSPASPPGGSLYGVAAPPSPAEPEAPSQPAQPKETQP